MQAKFGPAGNSTAFYEAGFKATLQAPGWLKELGLTAYEYQCGRGRSRKRSDGRGAETKGL